MAHEDYVDEETASYFGNIASDGFKTDEERLMEGYKKFKRRIFGFWGNIGASCQTEFSITVENSELEDGLCELGIVSPDEVKEFISRLEGKELEMHKSVPGYSLEFKRVINKKGDSRYRIISYSSGDY